MTLADDGYSPMQRASSSPAASPQSTNLGDILERVLDSGIVIAGDIRVNLLDIELLTIKLRLVVASLETAKETGIDWWEPDPWLTGNKSQLPLENEELRARIEQLEMGNGQRRAIEDRGSEFEDVEDGVSDRRSGGRSIRVLYEGAPHRGRRCGRIEDDRRCAEH